MCRETAFCCGYSLQSSAITAAILTATSAIVFTITGVQILSSADWIEQDSPTNGTNSKMFNYGHTNEEWLENKDDRIAMGVILKITGGALLGIASVTLVIFTCLCCAIYKKNPILLLPWLICTIIKIVFCFVVGLFLIWKIPYPPAPLFLLALLFEFYLWNCVRSYYSQLGEEKSSAKSAQQTKPAEMSKCTVQHENVKYNQFA